MLKSVFLHRYRSTTPKQSSAICKTAGFSNNDISVLMSDKSGTKDFATSTIPRPPKAPQPVPGPAPFWAAPWAGWPASAALAIPGLGPFIAAGPIMAALSGAAVVGAVGGLTGALVGMGIPEFEAKRYEGKVKSGSCLVSVHSEDSNETKRAKEIYERAGAGHHHRGRGCRGKRRP